MVYSMSSDPAGRNSKGRFGAKKLTGVFVEGRLMYHIGMPGFMQDNIFASHTFFGGHMDANC